MLSLMRRTPLARNIMDLKRVTIVTHRMHDVGVERAAVNEAARTTQILRTGDM